MQKRMWVVLLSALVTSLCASADTTVGTDWNLSPTGGTYSYITAGGVLTGSVGVLTVEGVDAGGSATTTPLAIVDGTMTFTTGDEIGTAGTTWEWGAGAPGIIVTGCISNVTFAGTCAADGSDNSTLVSDSFTSAAIDPGIYVAGVLNFPGVVFGGLTGTIEPAVLATDLGVSQNFSGLATDDLTPNGLAGGLPATTGATFPSVSTTAGTVSNPGTGGLDLASVSVPEEWSLSSTLGIFAFGLVVFSVARRLGLIKAVVSF